MKTPLISIIITLISINYSCKKPEVVTISDSTKNSNSNYKFYLDVDIDGEKFSYSVDTFDMYISNLYPTGGTHLKNTDQLLMGGGQMDAVPIQFYGHLETNGQLIGNFGKTMSTFPKIGYYLQIPNFSKLKVGDEISNDTVSIWNSYSMRNNAQYFLFHLEKWKKPFVALDSNCYDYYEAGIFRGTRGFIKNYNRNKPSLNAVKFKLLQKTNAIIKTQFGNQNIYILTGEITGKMQKYNEILTSLGITHKVKGYSEVQIKFSLPVGT